MPKLKFFPNDTRGRVLNDDAGAQHWIHIVGEFEVYTDDFPISLGRIGYKDYQVGKAKDSYGVYSRKIQNDKFKPYRGQYYMSLTATIDKAVKNACKYIVPYTHRELMEICYSDMQHKVYTSTSVAKQKLEEALRDVSNGGYLLEEILHLKHLGVEFKTSGFKELASNILELTGNVQEEQSRNIMGVFVRFRRVGDNVYADVSTARDLRRNYSVATDGKTTSYRVDELPSTIAGSISVLSILDDYQYVPRVGQKIDENTYWIETDGRAV